MVQGRADPERDGVADYVRHLSAALTAAGEEVVPVPVVGPREAAARLRAVEEGLPLARAAQTGISAVFDARGRRLALLPIGATGTLTLALPGADAAPPFARFGLALPALAAVFCMLPGLVASRSIRKRVSAA